MKDKKPFLFKEDYFKDWNYEEYSYSAPTVALALKWLRDIEGIKSTVSYSDFDGGWFYSDGKSDVYETYEEAESALLDELLKLIKTK